MSKQVLHARVPFFEDSVAPSPPGGDPGELRSASIMAGFVLLSVVLICVLAWIPSALPRANHGLDVEWKSKGATPVVHLEDGPVNHHWAKGSPAKGISADHFTGTWTGCITVPREGMHLQVRTYDSVKISVGEQSWTPPKNRFFHWNRQTLPVGTHPIEVAYSHERGSAHLYLAWADSTGAHRSIPRSALLSPRHADCK